MSALIRKNIRKIMMRLKKNDVVERIAGKKDYVLCAEKLGYSSVQIVYNWPKLMGPTLMKSIVLRMRANRIAVPDEWKSPKGK